MKYLTAVLTAWSLLAITNSTVLAYYKTDSRQAMPTESAKRMIVKLRPYIDVKLERDATGAMRMGSASVDAVNKQYGIVACRRLFNKSYRAGETDLLKNVFVLELPYGVDAAAVQAAYQGLEEVAYAHPDYGAQLYDLPSDPLYSHQWALNNTGQGHYHIVRYEGSNNDTLIITYGIPDADIDFQEVFDNPPDNTSTVVIAIIDTGVDRDHPDLAERMWTNSAEVPGNGFDDDHNGYIDDVLGWDFCGGGKGMRGPVSPDNDPSDYHGHGTHCAGITAAVTDNLTGVAGISDSRIMALKFGPYMISSLGAEAIVYAADNGADVISMSWGYPWPVDLLDDALAYARSKGVILCAASGNDEEEYTNYPAGSPNVITVGASNDSDFVTTFSTFGTHLDIVAPGLSILSLRAAGTDMYSDHGEPGIHIIDNDYYLASGTSMACPHVAGAAALLRAVSPGLTHDAAQYILQASADDFVDPYGQGADLPGWDKYSGHGRLNLYTALTMAPFLRAAISSPWPHAIMSGTVSIVGTADGAGFTEYNLEYGLGSDPSVWIPLYTGGTPVADGLLYDWDTDGINGQYTIRLQVGASHHDLVTIHICNDIQASITTPSHTDTIISGTPIFGSAACPDFEYLALEFRPEDSADAYDDIVTSTIPTVNGYLADWATGLLADGWYILRLSVYSDGGLETADSVSVYVQSLYATDAAWKVTLDTTACILATYGDMDYDDTNEVIVGTATGITFLNLDGTSKLDGVPSVPHHNFTTPPAIGDLDGDGLDDLVAVAHIPVDQGRLYGYPSTAAPFEVQLPAPPDIMNFYDIETQYHPGVWLADVDGDGNDEVHYFDGPGKYMIYNPDGSVLLNFAPQCRAPLTADLDNDGTHELYYTYAGTNFQYVYQADLTGETQNSVLLSTGATSGMSIRWLSAVDIDHDGKRELIALGPVLPEGQYWIFAMDENLAILSGWPHNTGIDKFLVPTPPIFTDIDGDASMDYFIAFFELAYGLVYAWHLDGTPLSGDSVWGLWASSPNPAKLYGTVTGDMDGDSRTDIVSFAAPDLMLTYDVERVIAWDRHADPLSGWPIVAEPTSPGMVGGLVTHCPTVGDIDQDGFVDMLATTFMNGVIFVRFDNAPFYPELAPVPFYRYNRRLNNLGPVASGSFLCGDMNGDGLGPNIVDVTFLVDYLFGEGSPPPDPEAADINGSDGTVNIVDLSWLVAYLFGGGSPPDCD